MTRRTKAWIIVPSVLILGISLIANVKYTMRLRGAEREFLNSRLPVTNDPDSYAFKSRGITYGMDVAKVDSILADASEVGGGIRKGFRSAKVYTFKYGEPFYDYIARRSEYMVTETMYIYFDEEGRADEIKYWRRISRSAERGKATLDLKNGVIVP